MQVTDLTMIYLYNVFVLGRVVDASVISSVAILYWMFFCICLCYIILYWHPYDGNKIKKRIYFPVILKLL